MKKLIIVLLAAIFVTACNNPASTDQADNSKDAEKAETVIAVIEVTGMHCESCVETVTNVLTELDGVEAAKVSLEKNKAKVIFDPNTLSSDQIKIAIEEKGYGVGTIEVKEQTDQSKQTEE